MAKESRKKTPKKNERAKNPASPPSSPVCYAGSDELRPEFREEGNNPPDQLTRAERKKRR